MKCTNRGGHVGQAVSGHQDRGPGRGPAALPGGAGALSYKGHARIVFGRTALPGESVEGDAPALTPLQHQQLRALVGKQVSVVRGLLAERGQTASYRAGAASADTPADQVPGTWYVYDVAPLPGNVVILWVSADGKVPAHSKKLPFHH